MDQSTEAHTIEQDIVSVLQSLGVEVHKITGDEVQCRCPDPIHIREKGRPSTRYSFYMNTDTTAWYCFTCGARGNLLSLMSDIVSDPAALWDLQSYMITSGLRRLSVDEATYDSDVEPDIDWMTFSKFDPVPTDKLKSRNLTEESATKYGLRWDSDKRRWIIPIVTPLGEPKGWQEKGVGVYKNYPTGVHKGNTLFGIERAFTPTVMLVESPLDVVRFHSAYQGAEVSCVASFGANVSDEQAQLLRRFDSIILALDNDQAGKSETNKLLKKIPWPQFFPYPEGRKDIGELTDLQIKYGLENLTSVPPV